MFVLCSLVDGVGLRTHFPYPMHRLQSSGYTSSGIYIDDLRWSPGTKIPENAFSVPFFDVIRIPIRHRYIFPPPLKIYFDYMHLYMETVPHPFSPETKNVFHFLSIIAHGLILSNPLSEYT